MNITDFIEGLCIGELSNLYIGLQGQVEISDQNRRKLIHYTNQGLKMLSSRFELLKRELIVVGKENVTLYPLRMEHSMRCGSSELRFIDDTCRDPFTGDLIKILEVRNSIGIQFPLNDVNHPQSVFTPSWDTLQLPQPIEGQPYFVIYQAKPIVLTPETGDCYDMNLPPILEEALMAYVAGKVYSHMNGDANKMTSQEHMANFEAKCLEAGGKDMTAESSVTSHTKAEDRGFI